MTAAHQGVEVVVHVVEPLPAAAVMSSMVAWSEAAVTSLMAVLLSVVATASVVPRWAWLAAESSVMVVLTMVLLATEPVELWVAQLLMVDMVVLPLESAVDLPTSSARFTCHKWLLKLEWSTRLVTAMRRVSVLTR